jgi:hypothetical protein
MFYHGNQTFIGLIKIIPVSFCFVNTSDGGRATEHVIRHLTPAKNSRTTKYTRDGEERTTDLNTQHRTQGLPNTPEMERREPQT